MKGGAREGAGRRPIYEGERMQRVTVRLPVDYLTWAQQEGGGNVSEGLRRLLERLDQLEGAQSAVKGA